MKYLIVLLLFLNFSLHAQMPEKRTNYGQLNELDFANLKRNLSTKEITANLIVIIYYPGKDSCNGMERVSTWNIFHTDYKSQLNRIADNEQFWVYKNNENLKYYHPEEVKWQADQNQFVEKMFFTKPYPCASFVAITQTGKFISYFGEFGKQHVWKVSEELLNTK